MKNTKKMINPPFLYFLYVTKNFTSQSISIDHDLVSKVLGVFFLVLSDGYGWDEGVGGLLHLSSRRRVDFPSNNSY